MHVTTVSWSPISSVFVVLPLCALPFCMCDCELLLSKRDTMANSEACYTRFKVLQPTQQLPQKSNRDNRLYADGVYAVEDYAWKFEVTMKINLNSTQMELDAGAGVTIVKP
ncbi:conserved hypothetical protein [Trichinella spiralis]|uniref:hypothetical protein n=1 Tax=Trichinella spiralis TaxID=6334 RepID=UPI0001EFD1BB|nr:conserved hypothetical protein [Trichinella spiralis]